MSNTLHPAIPYHSLKIAVQSLNINVHPIIDAYIWSHKHLIFNSTSNLFSMKIQLLFLFTLLIGFSSQAQKASVNFSTEIVAVTEVPVAVQSAQDKYFPGITVRQWKKLSASAQRTGSRYLAVFNQQKNNTRAKYEVNGKGLTAYTSYALSAAPAAIKSAVASQYSAYQLTRVEKITSLTKGKAAFRTTLRKGAQKLTVWLDENGNELKPQQLPTEITTEEAAP